MLFNFDQINGQFYLCPDFPLPKWFQRVDYIIYKTNVLYQEKNFFRSKITSERTNKHRICVPQMPGSLSEDYSPDTPSSVTEGKGSQGNPCQAQKAFCIYKRVACETVPRCSYNTFGGNNEGCMEWLS